MSATPWGARSSMSAAAKTSKPISPAPLAFATSSASCQQSARRTRLSLSRALPASTFGVLPRGRQVMKRVYRAVQVILVLSIMAFAPWFASAETPGQIPQPWTYEGSKKLQEQERQRDQQSQPQSPSPQGGSAMVPGGGAGGAAAAKAEAARRN